MAMLGMTNPYSKNDIIRFFMTETYNLTSSLEQKYKHFNSRTLWDFMFLSIRGYYCNSDRPADGKNLD